VSGLLAAFVLAASVGLVAAGAGSAGPSASGERQGRVVNGRVVYEQNCAVCHGTSGDGRGMAQMMLRTKPRDFREGIFKFRSTPTGSLPTDEDLFGTISKGLRGTGMIAQGHLSEDERRAVVEYVKTFSERFRSRAPRSPVVVAEPPPRTPALVAKGRKLFEEAGCSACHGAEGKGDGPSASELRDRWGYPVPPADLTRPLKRGSTARDIYTTLATGLDGTPMPSYEAALSEEELWALAHYVASLNTGVLSQGQLAEERAGEMVVRMHARGGMMGRMPTLR
jgi:mono/diheme cytochrome c family protein